jgi:nucleoside-diphosphate-sugar epimerase
MATWNGGSFVKVLVIGGTGLISTAIVRELVERGDTVTVLNRAERQGRPNGVGQIIADRTDPVAFEAAIGASGTWDAVIDMICFVPDEAAVAARVLQGRTGQYVMTSTIDVYRKPAPRLPYVEDTPHGGIGQYALDKVACERILWAAHDRGGLPLTVIRPAATYGEGGRLVQPLGFRPTLIDRLRKGKPIVVHGDGSSLWVSCHRDDVATAFVGAVSRPATTIGHAYHVTGEEWVTWDQHLTLVAEAAGAPPPDICHIPSDALRRISPDAGRLAWENFRFHNVFDNAAAHRDLDFRYRVSLRDGLPRLVASLDARGAVEDSDLDPLDDRIIGTWRAMVTEAELTLAPLDPVGPPKAGKV